MSHFSRDNLSPRWDNLSGWMSVKNSLGQATQAWRKSFHDQASAATSTNGRGLTDSLLVSRRGGVLEHVTPLGYCLSHTILMDESYFWALAQVWVRIGLKGCVRELVLASAWERKRKKESERCGQFREGEFGDRGVREIDRQRRRRVSGNGEGKGSKKIKDGGTSFLWGA